MISRKHRFHGLGSLRRVYKQGRTVRSELMAVKMVANERRQTYRLAVVVAKKVSKSAVVRNRIRRRIFEIVRQREGEINQPLDIVISVYSASFASAPPGEVENAVYDLMERVGIIKNPGQRALPKQRVIIDKKEK